MPKPGINEFFDLNKLQKGWGNIIFPVSMSKILKDQNAAEVFNHLKIFQPSKISENKVGITILYSDGLYQWKPDEEKLDRRQVLNFLNNHRNAYGKLLSKNSELFQIQQAFDFKTWDSISILTDDFIEKYNRAFDLVKSDNLFKKYLEEDCNYFNRPTDKNQFGFFIEEILVFYLITKMKVYFNNTFTDNRGAWALLAYPGKPLKSLVYFYQKNIFGINNTGNKYENCFYDLTAKKLYDFDRLDLETWDYE